MIKGLLVDIFGYTLGTLYVKTLKNIKQKRSH